MHTYLCACNRGDILPMLPRVHGVPLVSMPSHGYEQIDLSSTETQLAVGTQLVDISGTPLFRVVGRFPMPAAPHSVNGLLLQALTDMPGGNIVLSCLRPGYALAWITLSDKGAQGLRTDASGPLIAEMVRGTMSLCYEQGFIIPDDPHSLTSLVVDLALGQRYDLILTSGGTGLAPRDITPETLTPLLERRLYGLEQAMMLAGLSKTPTAGLSRAVAGTLGGALVLSLPGSPKAVRENLAAVLPALGHGLEKLHGDPADCGSANEAYTHARSVYTQ